MLKHLFVYGTLQPGRAPAIVHDIVQRFVFVSDATVRGCLYSFGRYPGVLLRSDAPYVHGRIYALPPDLRETLKRLDAYEGCVPSNPAASLFLRVACRPALPGGRRMAAWIYVYNRPVTNVRCINSEATSD